jgi:hypothetical protein
MACNNICVSCAFLSLFFLFVPFVAVKNIQDMKSASIRATLIGVLVIPVWWIMRYVRYLSQLCCLKYSFHNIVFDNQWIYKALVFEIFCNVLIWKVTDFSYSLKLGFRRELWHVLLLFSNNFWLWKLFICDMLLCWIHLWLFLETHCLYFLCCNCIAFSEN